MRLNTDPPGPERGLWITTVIFLLSVLAGHPFLEERGFLPILLLVGLIHVFLSAPHGSRCSWQFLVAQNLVVISAVSAVVLHVRHLIGPAREPAAVLVSFALASWSTGSFYLHFVNYVLVFLLVTGALYGLVRRLVSSWETAGYVSLLYSASAVNVAIDYAVRRPLYQVQGSPEDKDFLFAAGLLGAEFSVLLYLLCLAAYGIGCWRRLRRTASGSG